MRAVSLLSGLIFLLAPGVALAQEAADPNPEQPAAEGELVEEGEALSDGADIAARCGTQPITIASMPWPSAQILAEIHARILSEEFGCEAQIVGGDLAATAMSMGAGGQPAVAPEMWIARVAEAWNQASRDQRVRQAGVTFVEPTLEGWYIPDYVAEAQPELTTPAALAQSWQLFAAPGAPKGRFISCPADWACAVINRNLLKAHGLDAVFDVVEPANRLELDTLISEAQSRREPIVFYYWQPNAVLAQFGFRGLQMGAFNAEAMKCLAQAACPTPTPSGFAEEPVAIALTEWVYTDAPEVAAYFQRARMPLADMNTLLAALGEGGATAGTVAERFLATREELWREWVGAPIPAAAE